METNNLEPATTEQVIITNAQLLEHWQGHRNLTRKVIEAFPEKELYTFSLGGMRTFAELTMEMIDIASPGVEGIATRTWKQFGDMNGVEHPAAPDTKESLLALWDSVTDKINNTWPQIDAERFQEHDVAFGQYEGQIYSTLFYIIDNEIHHRGQGYVYLRVLGIEPPFFWDR